LAPPFYRFLLRRVSFCSSSPDNVIDLPVLALDHFAAPLSLPFLHATVEKMHFPVSTWAFCHPSIIIRARTPYFGGRRSPPLRAFFSPPSSPKTPIRLCGDFCSPRASFLCPPVRSSHVDCAFSHFGPESQQDGVVRSAAPRCPLRTLGLTGRCISSGRMSHPRPWIQIRLLPARLIWWPQAALFSIPLCWSCQSFYRKPPLFLEERSLSPVFYSFQPWGTTGVTLLYPTRGQTVGIVFSRWSSFLRSSILDV